MPKSTSAFCVALTVLTLAGSSGSAQQQTVAQVHLGNARPLLQSLPAGKFSDDKDDNEDATEEVAKLQRQFDELVNGFEASPDSPTEAGWKLKFSEIERTIARLIGGGSVVGPAIKRLNPDVRRQLEMFRTEIELFYVAPVAERR